MARSEAMVAAIALLGGCDLVVGIETEAERCELASFAQTPPVDVVEAEDFSIDWDMTFGVVMSAGSTFELDLATKALTPSDLGPYMNIGLALTPEGNALFYTATLEPMVLKGALRGDDPTWVQGAGVPRGTFAGTPSADVFGPRRLLVKERPLVDEILEYEDVGGRWMRVGDVHALASVRAPNLTPNGLTMVYTGLDDAGMPAVLAAQRPSIAEWFGAPTVLQPGMFQAAQLLGDCKRLYTADATMLRQQDL